jgi:hypothetical protein
MFLDIQNLVAIKLGSFTDVGPYIADKQKNYYLVWSASWAVLA